MNIKQVMQLQNEYKNKKFDVKHLKWQLIQLKNSIMNNEQLIYEALKQDLNKNPQETLLTELAPVVNEVKWFIKNINSIHKMKKNKSFKDGIVSKSYVHRKSYGNVMIYSPYNYPFQLAMVPIVGALACNNTILLKPSEHTPKTNEVMAKILAEAFDKSQAHVIENKFLHNHEIYKELYTTKFDMVFFTGGTEVGRRVYTNYSQQLIPVILELGGKSPVIIDKHVDLKKAIPRLVWSKLLNSGQTCVAPDYLIIHESIEKDFVNELIKYIDNFKSDELVKDLVYVSKSNIARLKDIVKNDEMVYSRDVSPNHCPIMLVKPKTMTSKSMTEELFGPVFPILTYSKDSDIKNIINKCPNPLATYVYSKSKSFIKQIHEDIVSGAVMANNCVLHVNLHVPFGGVRESGVGRYHKDASVEAFTRFQPLVYASNFNTNFTFMPYSDQKFKKIKSLFKNKMI
ncbi:MAG: aldehyde dehydrogenase family protein [Mycoplasma sp.]